MLDVAKQFAVGGQVDKCNEVLATYVVSAEFREFAKSYLKSDIEFYGNAVDQFSLQVVPDELSSAEDRDEPPYGSILACSAFAKHVNTAADLMTHLLHSASHQRCDILWQRCPVPMNSINEQYLDWIEEIYNQRLVKVVAPDAFQQFPQALADWDRMDNKIIPVTRVDMQQMLLDDTKHPNQRLQQLHDWLYTVDPLDQRVFNQYMKVWVWLLETDVEVQQIMQEYVGW